jgi:hypothetical protein
MGLLIWLRRLYSLDTLDTRFTVSATTPLKAAADDRSRAASSKSGPSNQGRNGASPSRWNTLEFYVYYAIVGTAIPLMFKAAIEVSRGIYPSPDIDAWKNLLADI